MTRRDHNIVKKVVNILKFYISEWIDT